MINNYINGEAIKSRKEEEKTEIFGKKYFDEFRKNLLKEMIKIGKNVGKR